MQQPRLGLRFMSGGGELWCSFSFGGLVCRATPAGRVLFSHSCPARMVCWEFRVGRFVLGIFCWVFCVWRFVLGVLCWRSPTTWPAPTAAESTRCRKQG